MPESALAEFDVAAWPSSESRSLSRRVHLAPLAELPELQMVQRIATCHAVTDSLDTHSHDGLEITFVERGFLEWTTDAHVDELSGGDVLVTWAGEVHGPANGILAPCILHTLRIALWDTPQSGAPGFLGVPMSESMLLVDALRNLPARRFAAPPDLAARFARLLDCLDEPGRLTAVRARAILLELLLTVVDASAADGRRERSALVERAISMIDSHLDEPLEMTRVARDLGCSVSYLATRFRREVGIPPAQYHLRRRIHEAARRLRSADSITSVAFDFGFASSQHFTTAFKRVTGMAPRDYRVTQCRPRPIAC